MLEVVVLCEGFVALDGGGVLAGSLPGVQRQVPKVKPFRLVVLSVRVVGVTAGLDRDVELLGPERILLHGRVRAQVQIGVDTALQVHVASTAELAKQGLVPLHLRMTPVNEDAGRVAVVAEHDQVGGR